jgi:predicted component of type VI protein secretion system
MKTGVSTFHVSRADIAVDPVTLITEGLVIGRAGTCDVLLNHPSVSRSHAGIRQLDKDFYVFNLSPTNATTLNGKLVEAPQVLVSGDTLQIGPFFLAVERDRDSLSLTVSLQVGIHIGELGARANEMKDSAALARDSAAHRPNDKLTVSMTPLAAPAVEALEVFWQKRQREAGKVERSSPLHPRGERKLGKARYNWKPTTDLARRRTGGIFIWSVL